MGQNNGNQIFMLCIENKDCEDLERRKIYQVLHDSEASKEGYVRVFRPTDEGSARSLIYRKLNQSSFLASWPLCFLALKPPDRFPLFLSLNTP